MRWEVTTQVTNHRYPDGSSAGVGSYDNEADAVASVQDFVKRHNLLERPEMVGTPKMYGTVVKWYERHEPWPPPEPEHCAGCQCHKAEPRPRDRWKPYRGPSVSTPYAKTYWALVTLREDRVRW